MNSVSGKALTSNPTLIDNYSTGLSHASGQDFGKGHSLDIEYKSDNFARGPRSEEGLARMNTQIDKDIANLLAGYAKPHWHFEHDPRVAPEMLPLLDRMNSNNITWTSGHSTPTL